MGILQAISTLLPDGLDRSAPRPPSYMGAGVTTMPGPAYLDAFQKKRSPFGPELVEQYKTLVFACTQLNAIGTARVPMRLMCDASKGGRPREMSGPRSINRSYFGHLQRSGYLQRSTASHQDVQEITDHPVLEMLDHPDSEGYFSRFDLIALMVAYCDVVGVGYLKLDPPGEKVPPTYCWPLQAQYVYDVKTPGTPVIERYTYFGDTYRPAEILRFRPPSLSLRDPYGRGYSATLAALQYAQLEDMFLAIQTQLLGNGPRPNLIVSPSDPTMPWGEAERLRLIQDYNRQLTGGNAGGILATNGSTTVTPVSYAPADMGTKEISEYDLQRVCNVFGVPISYFSTETNLANLQAAEAQHSRLGVEPRCMSIAGTLTRLVRRYDPRLFVAFDAAVQEDKEQEARIFDMAIKNQRATINETNVDSPFEPKPWGDEPWMPGTLTQPSMAMESHAQGLEAQKAAVENESTMTQFQTTEAAADGDPGNPDDAPDAGAGRGLDDPGLPAVHGGSVEDALAALERAMGVRP